MSADHTTCFTLAMRTLFMALQQQQQQQQQGKHKKLDSIKDQRKTREKSVVKKKKYIYIS